MDTLTIVFYSVVLAVFIIAVVLVVIWFYRNRNNRSETARALLSPRTLAALNGYCVNLRTAEEAVGAAGRTPSSG
jgi:hypothetical protein